MQNANDRLLADLEACSVTIDGKRISALDLFRFMAQRCPAGSDDYMFGVELEPLLQKLASHGLIARTTPQPAHEVN